MVVVRTKPTYGRRAQPNRKAKGEKRSRPPKKRKVKPAEKRSPRPGPALPYDNAPADDEETVVSCKIHLNLREAVGINAAMPPHFMFDVTPPYVEYKRGDAYSEDKPFPERGATYTNELTDAAGDENGRKWMPYMPREYTCVPYALLHSQN